MDPNTKTLIEKKVGRFNTLSQCVRLAEKVLQKSPELIQNLHEELEAVPDEPGKMSRGLYTVRQFLLKRIFGAIDGSEAFGLPNRLENYLSFLDLAWVVHNVDEKTKITWYTFGLQDYDYEENGQLEWSRIRRRLKSFIPDTHLGSVQIEKEQVNEETGVLTERIFVRIAMVVKGKREINNQKKLLRQTGTHFVIHLNEPYFFCDNPNPDPDICKVLCSCFNSEGYFSIPLSGTHLQSLRQLRQNRDARRACTFSDKDGKASQYINAIIQGHLVTDEEEEAGRSKIPILNKLTCTAPVKFQNKELIESFHGRPMAEELDDLHIKATFKGPHVLASLKELASNKSKESIFVDPVPNWVFGASARGRDVFKIQNS